MNTHRENRPTPTPWFLGAVVLLGLVTAGRSATAQQDKRLSFQQVTRIVRSVLSEKRNYAPGDLIDQADVTRVIKALGAAGQAPADAKQLLADTLPEEDALVRMLSTERGVRFMRKVKDDDLIFDRMDRVCRVSGGQRMLTDIIRLPDGEKLAKLKRPHGVPGFLDLLPKNSSGKVRRIKDYEESTGRIYTEDMLLERLKPSYSKKPA